MLNLTKLVEELKDDTEWQETPMPLTDDQYMGMIVHALERLFVDTGRAALYDESKYKTVEVVPNPDTEESEEEPDKEPTGEEPEEEPEEEPVVETYYAYDADFLIDEKVYIMLCARMGFFKKVQSDVNNTFGYSTDALTVTNADKPYVNLKNTLEELDNERRIVYYKMYRYALGVE